MKRKDFYFFEMDTKFKIKHMNICHSRLSRHNSKSIKIEVFSRREMIFQIYAKETLKSNPTYFTVSKTEL